MGWISWALLASIVLQLIATLIWLERVGRAPFHCFLPNASERTWQTIILAIFVVSWLILITDNILASKERQLIDKIKSTPPIVDTWLELKDNGDGLPNYVVNIECKSHVPIHFRWRVVGYIINYSYEKLPGKVLSSSKGYLSCAKLSKPNEPSIFIDEQIGASLPFFSLPPPSSLALLEAEIELIVDYQSVYFEEMHYMGELKDQAIRKYQMRQFLGPVFDLIEVH